MFDGVPAALLDDLSAPAIVGFAVLLVLFGGLVPRWSHKERINDKNQQIAALQYALDKRDEQVEKLLDSNKLIITLLESIKSEAGKRQRD